MSIECPKCGKRVRILVPEGGDGSADVYARHKMSDGTYCQMSRQVVEHYKPGAFVW